MDMLSNRASVDNRRQFYITYFKGHGFIHDDFAEGVEYWTWPNFVFRITAKRRRLDPYRVLVRDGEEDGYEYHIADIGEYFHAVAAADAGHPYDASRHGDYRQLQPTRRSRSRSSTSTSASWANRQAEKARQRDTEADQRHAKQLDEVARLLKLNRMHRDIADQLGVSRSRVSQLVRELKEAGHDSV